MNSDFLSLLIIGAATFLAMDAACYLWLRANAGRFDRQPVRIASIVDRRKAGRLSDR